MFPANYEMLFTAEILQIISLSDSVTIFMLVISIISVKIYYNKLNSHLQQYTLKNITGYRTRMDILNQ